MVKQIKFPFMKGRFRHRFKKVYVCDFEYANVGGALIPTSVAIKDINDPNAEVDFIWLRDEINPDNRLNKYVEQPYDHDPQNLFVGFLCEAEASAIHEMGWWQPERVIDLYAECKNYNNGLISGKNKDGEGVFSLAAMAKKYRIETNYLADDKTNLRQRLGNNLVGPDEKETVRRYNVEDVLVTERLFDFWEDLYDDLYEGGIIWEQALDRGQASIITGVVGRTGLPIDVPAWNKFTDKFDEIINDVISDAHKNTGCFPDNKFNSKRFAGLVFEHQLDSNWPKTKKGAFKSDADTLRIYEELEPFRVIKEALYLKGATKLRDLPIDPKDDRAKTMLWMFGAKTGRCTPSTAKYIPNMAGCMTPFVKVPEGVCLIKCDYGQQEFAIAAVLASDEVMLEAYETGDPYLDLGKKSDYLKEDATKDHPLRAVFKVVCLMTQYGAGVESMARKMKKPIETAEMIFQVHQRVFNKFWAWQEKMVDRFSYDGEYQTANGWRYKLPKGSTFRQYGETEGYSEATLKNWLVQATGAEILRRAMRKLYDNGFKIVALVHDEIIVECISHEALDKNHYVEKVQELMQDAAREIIGWPIKTDAKVYDSGERFDPKDPADLETFKFFAKKAGFDV